MPGTRRFLGSLIRRRCRSCARARGDGGFALIEVLVAFTILFIVLTSLGFEMGAQYSSVGSSKIEQTGQGLLARALNEVRALPYTTVAKGLSTSDITGNATAKCTHQSQTTYLATTDTTWKLTDPALSGGDGPGESLLTFSPIGSNSNPPAPLYPHRSCATVNNVLFTVRVFPTKYSTALTGSSATWVTREIRVTAIVSWTKGGGGPLVGQTIVYPKTVACSSLAALTHANTAACQPDFTAVTSAGNGSIGIKPISGTAIEGLSFTDFQLLLPGTSSSEFLTGTSAVDGSAQASGVETTPTSTRDQVSRVESKASSDLASGTSNYQTVALSSSTSAVTLTSSTSAYSITGSPSSDDSGTTTSTTSATSSRICANFTPTPQTTGLPCGSGRATQQSTATLTASFGTLGRATLASVATITATWADRVFNARYAKGATNCPSTATSGCVNAEAAGGLGAVGLAGLPQQVIGPTGWNKYLVQLSGFHAKETVWARSATTYLSGAASTVAGILSYYTATTHAYKTVTIGATPHTLTVSPVTIGSVTLAANLIVGGDTCTSTTTSSHPSKPHLMHCSVSPLSGTITYKVTKGTTTIADFTMTVALGSVTATASYEVAT